MNKLFETERLFTSSIGSIESIPLQDVVDTLTAKVTEFLPPDWQKISNRENAAIWLDHRLNEGDIFSVINKDTMACMGFMFIHGMHSESGGDTIRLGYLIAEKYWAKGFASELIRGLVAYCKEQGFVKTITGGVVPENHGSVRVLVKNGFHFLSTDEHADYYVYEF